MYSIYERSRIHTWPFRFINISQFRWLPINYSHAIYLFILFVTGTFDLLNHRNISHLIFVSLILVILGW